MDGATNEAMFYQNTSTPHADLIERVSPDEDYTCHLVEANRRAGLPLCHNLEEDETMVGVHLCGDAATLVAGRPGEPEERKYLYCKLLEAVLRRQSFNETMNY